MPNKPFKLRRASKLERLERRLRRYAVLTGRAENEYRRQAVRWNNLRLKILAFKINADRS